MHPVMVEFVGGPADGERVWYDGAVPTMVELTREDRIMPSSKAPWGEHPGVFSFVPGAPAPMVVTRVVRYVRTESHRFTYWPKGRRRPKPSRGKG